MKRKLLLILYVFLLQVFTLFGQEYFVETETVTKREDVIHTYKHQATGLEVVWIESDDPNWSFVLGVRTPVETDTGVNHIIEHTVFKGSKAYPSHQLFFDASAKYPHSFMNAMTSSDMTYYPFATPYPKCFEALMDVYLDSVLNPLMIQEPYSFYEEAYYKDPVSGKEGGVVYNEMKGANSSIDRQVFKGIRQAYFEGGTYGYDSGGMPQAIKGLTYDYFKETYEKYYHPSNMAIILYGNLPIDRVLGNIQEKVKDYEGNHEHIVIDDAITQSEATVQKAYQSQNQKAFLLKSFLIDRKLTPQEQIKLSLWVSTYLQDHSGSFQTALRQQGIKNVQVIKDEGTKTPIYTLAVGDVALDQLAAVDEKLESLLGELGRYIPTDLAVERDALARQKLAILQEGDSSQRGLGIATSYLEEWLRQGEKHSYYTQLESIGEMKELDNLWCQQVFLSGVKRTTRMIPSKISQQEVAISGNQAWNGVSQQIENWKKQHASAELPEVEPEALMMETGASCERTQKKGVTYLLTPTGNPSLYTTLYYPSHHIKQEELPYFFLYSIMLEEAAKDYSPFEAFVQVSPMALGGSEEETYLKITLLQEDPHANPMDLVAHMKESLEKKELSWYEAQLERWVQSYRESFGGDILGTLQSLNESSNEGAGRYLFEGSYPLYQFVMRHMANVDEAFVQDILTVGNKIRPVKGMKIGLIGERALIDTAKQVLIDTVDPDKAPERVSYHFKTYPKNSLYYHVGGVDYLVYSYEEMDKLVTGTEYVTAAYATLGYLQPVIRGEQGAYGSGMSVGAPYRIGIYTYRDPDYRKSLTQIDQMPAFLGEKIHPELLKAAKTEALGAFQRQYQLLGSKQRQGEMLQKLELLGIKPSYLQKTQKQILKCDAKALQSALEVLKEKIDASRLGICTQRNKAPRDFNGVIYE